MSTVVDPFIKRLRDIEDDIPNILKKIVTENSSEIVLLVKGQLSRGKNSYNLPLSWKKGTGYYSPYTQSYADRDNVRTPKTQGTPYNFSWTNETLDNLELGKITNKDFEVKTIAYKQKLLEGIYGEIFDLTEENNEYINNEIIYPKFIEYLLNESVRNLI